MSERSEEMLGNATSLEDDARFHQFGAFVMGTGGAIFTGLAIKLGFDKEAVGTCLSGGGAALSFTAERFMYNIANSDRRNAQPYMSEYLRLESIEKSAVPMPETPTV